MKKFCDFASILEGPSNPWPKSSDQAGNVHSSTAAATYSDYRSRKTEVKYLEEIRDNLKFDLADIQFNIHFNHERLRSNEITFQYKNVINFEAKDDHYFQFLSFIPELIKVVDIDTVWTKGKLIDEKAVLNNYQFKNVVTMNIHLRRTMLGFYNALLANVQNTIAAIDRELRRR